MCILVSTSCKSTMTSQKSTAGTACHPQHGRGPPVSSSVRGPTRSSAGRRCDDIISICSIFANLDIIIKIQKYPNWEPTTDSRIFWRIVRRLVVQSQSMPGIGQNRMCWQLKMSCLIVLKNILAGWRSMNASYVHVFFSCFFTGFQPRTSTVFTDGRPLRLSTPRLHGLLDVMVSNSNAVAWAEAWAKQAVALGWQNQRGHT